MSAECRQISSKFG